MVACNTTALLMLGVWNMLWHFSPDYNPWTTCPNTLEFVRRSKNYFTDGYPQQKHINDHIHKYSCLDRTYMVSKYEYSDCTFRSIQESVGLIKKQFERRSSKESRQNLFNFRKGAKKTSTKKIYFVGDSLMIQYFIALRCALESHRLLNVIEPVYTTDVFLRFDIVCDERCATNDTFYAQSRTSSCFGCKHNREKADYRKDYFEHPLMWANNVPKDTIAILLGVGSWYNNHKKITNSNEVFRDTMIKTRVLIEKIRNETSNDQQPINFYWMGLPTDTSLFLSKYGSKTYAEKDMIAYNVLTPIGVQFVNVSHLTSPRKNHDYNSCADGLHWW